MARRFALPGPRSLPLALALALVAGWSLLASADPARYPWIIGHRGGSHLRPENTLPAYEFSLDGGATGLEIDVWLSSDGFPVCHHDLTLDRTTNGMGPITEKTLAEILGLDAGSWFGNGEYTGTPVPRFEEALAEVAGRGKLFLDVKQIAFVPTVVATLESEGFAPDDVWVWDRFGNGPPFKDLMPEAHMIGSMVLNRDREEWIQQRVATGHEGVSEVYGYLTQDYVDLVHSYGMLVMSHTVLAPDFQTQVDLGVDIVVAPRPTFFAEQHLPAPISTCSDGIDNDGDGLTDYPAEASCWGAAAQTEETACSNGIDDDGDGDVDYPDDAGCYAAFYTAEDPQCDDGLDNNGDGDVDYPDDAGCLASYDQSEQVACANGVDDDGDGLVDYPDDPGCWTPSHTTEQPECEDGLDNDGDGLVDHPDDPGCYGSGDESEHPGTPSCNDGVDNDGDGLFDHREDPECLGPNDFTEGAECADGIDNDGDGLTDGGDPDCRDAGDPTEQGECRDGLDDDGDGRVDLLDDGCWTALDGTELPDCSDGLDNDGDGQADHPADPQCASPDDGSELPACSDAVDNDGDGQADHPADPQCSSPDDDSELSACSDGVDNDGDGDVDMGDAGCRHPGDLTEEPDCSDGVDNDGDGLTDHPADPQCQSPDGAIEWVAAGPPALGPAAGALVLGLLYVARRTLKRRLS
ncbi:MAG: glycerophosphodiester phosphodiesterase [Myxococcota bacterium]|nr:glycerophosphodiester phosphodiesterase [Myxococcota bacterium]